MKHHNSSHSKSKTLFSAFKRFALPPQSRTGSSPTRKSKPKQSKQNPHRKLKKPRISPKDKPEKVKKSSNYTDPSCDVSRGHQEPRSWPTSFLEVSKAAGQERNKKSTKKMKKKPKKRSKGHTASNPLDEDEGKMQSHLRGKKSQQLKKIIQKITVSSNKNYYKDSEKYSSGMASTGKVVHTPNQSIQLREKPVQRVLPFSYEEGALQCDQQLVSDHELSLGQQLKHHYPDHEAVKHQFPAIQTISESSLKEDSLVIDWDYLSKSQEVSTQTRFMLINALLQYAAFARHQRETFYLAVEFMDLFASLQHVLTPTIYKIIGVTGLIISIKKQQSHDCMMKLSAISNLPLQQLRKSEISMLRTFKFELKNRTLNRYINSMTARWDSFVETPAFLNTYIVTSNPHLQEKPIRFREHDGQSYLRMSELYQLADAAVHRIQFLRFGRKKLAASLMYLILRSQLQERGQPIEGMKEKFSVKPSPFYLDKLGFNQLFSQFLMQHSRLQLGQLVGCVQATSRLLSLKVRRQLPSLGWQCQSYEQLLGLTIFNPNLKDYMIKQFCQ